MGQQWVCAQGACVLVPSGPDSKKHLFAVMLDPVPIAGYGSKPMALMACASSITGSFQHDDACELKAGEHPFITHDSFIDYRFTRMEPAELVQARVKDGTFIAKEPCSAALVQKIIAGALKSRRINREYRNVLEQLIFKQGAI